MKNKFIVDKLGEIDESIKIGMEIDFYRYYNNKWEKISITNFKIIEREEKKKLLIFTYLLKDINGIFNSKEWLIRLCVSEDKCRIKTINRKNKYVFTDVKEMKIKILNKVKNCDDKEAILTETIRAEILYSTEIDNNAL